MQKKFSRIFKERVTKQSNQRNKLKADTTTEGT